MASPHGIEELSYQMGKSAQVQCGIRDGPFPGGIFQSGGGLQEQAWTNSDVIQSFYDLKGCEGSLQEAWSNTST